MEIRELVQKAHTNAREKGFWQDYDRALDLQNENNAIATRLMLIVSELSEALEALRKDDLDNFQEELADTAIRLADLSGGLGIDLEIEIIKKMEKNQNRPYKHGKQF
ncbi:MazG nucleotide pyrophosphohydrolase domain-containing protein [Clostridium sp. USBA 49]|uniref:MazG nucleotide pyrophosphohydrolase domain-containing protein n=1 Tax=Clostridium sp. USBA 49 TaxID=1881060 RepID=UPI00099A9F0F|nr:MazG nucleotide pyrophosphohydrolase domain-containing protein [Clostridium sp. USBA 49]SKA89574.1 MazG nucleotide pyrophosphohydrolase domain-containing protein [Clostridium sp. USBA 49]